MRKAVQADLFEGKREHGPRRYHHGGDLNRGKRKLARPFKRNAPMHIVFKSSQATGKNSMRSPQNKLEVDRILRREAKRNDAKIHAEQNVGDHLHVLISFKTRLQMCRFMRATTGLIAKHVDKTKKGKPASKKFWDSIPFSRIVQGFKDFYGVLRYIAKNQVEAELGKEARQRVEKLDKAQAKAAKTGRPITDFL